jgi:hypothetical protein
VRDDQFLYVADGNLPLVHVVDLSNPAQPEELPPFVATSLAVPSRVIAIRDIAVSPATRDVDPATGRNRRFLYAIDRDEGSILVYDVTDPAHASRTPMRRPHPELNPFQPEDRIGFSSPAVAISFARHDFPLSLHATVPNAATGLLCNANPNLNPPPDGGLPPDPIAPDDPVHPRKGFYYRNDRTEPDVALGPKRLRGIFAFATLANGQIVTIDVDDWDSPCRRPRNLDTPPNPNAPVSVDDGGTPPPPAPGDLAQPQPSSGPTDIDPYHAPETDQNATSEEQTFPIVPPHGLRADTLFATNATTGNHVPFLNARAMVNSNGAVFVQQGTGSENTPLMLPANVARPKTLAMTAAPIGLQFALDEADVHADQDWILTYEGAIPGFDGLSATVDTNDGYQSLVLTQPNGRFCAKGVEDVARGAERAPAIQAAWTSGGAAPVPRLERKLVDYVQLTEDLLPIEDAYWGLPQTPWGEVGAPSDGPGRWTYCNNIFGAGADQNASRDFPIVEAYEDHLVITRFSPDDLQTRNAEPKFPTNAGALKQLQLCFHHQVKFHVRTGFMWSLVGYAPGTSNVGLGFLAHLTAAAPDGRCVASCDPRKALLDGRLVTTPSAYIGPPGRNSPLALRNPFFALWLSRGAVPPTDAQGRVVTPPPVAPVARDTVYSNIVVRGMPTTQIINLASDTVAVDVQSMRFIESLGQIAVVDAAAKGLVLIDLGAVAVAHAPYF